MSSFDLTPEEERQLQKELDDSYNNFQQKKKNSSPALAQNMSSFYNRFPYASPDVLVPTVQAFTEGKMSERDAVLFLEDLTNRMSINEANDKKLNVQPKKKSWWERNVADKVKTGSRWAFAGLNTTYQGYQNVLSMATEAGANARQEGFSNTFKDITFDGFIISTDLGTMLDNDKNVGEGFFIGSRAAQLQADRAREFRGTVNGSAFTPGRYIADTFVQPGTKEYNILSGLVDTAFAIGVPAVPGGKVVTAGAKYGASSAAGVAGLRSMAGLRGYESALIIPAKANDFLNSRAGRSVIKRMTKINTIDEAVEKFPTADVKWLKNVADITDETVMRQFLNDSIGLGDETLGSAPRSVDDWNISRWDTIKNNGLKQRNSLVSRMMSTMPGGHVVLAGGSDREKLQSVKNVKNYLRLLRIDKDKRANLVDEFARAIADDDGSMKNVAEQLDTIIRESLSTLGTSDDLVDEMMKGVTSFKDSYNKALYGAINDTGDSADFGGIFDVIVDGKIVEGYQPLNTAGLQSEMLRHSMMLPDARQTKRIAAMSSWYTGKIGVVTGKAGVFDPLKRGEQRLPVAFVEAVQNQIWRPLALLTGGYVLRNMSDSLLRQSFDPNVKSGIFHPFELINLAIFKRMKGDILGETFEGNFETLIRNGQREMAEASSGTLREGRDVVTRYAREQKSGVWKRVKRSDNPTEFSNGVASELSLLASDEAARMVARGDTVDDIIDILSNDPKKKYLRELQNRWKNRTLTLQDGSTTVGTVEFLDAAGNVNIKNLETYLNKYIIPRIESTTGGSNVLKTIIGTGEYVDANGVVRSVFKFDPDGLRVVGYEKQPLFTAIKEVVNDPNVPLKEFYKVQETFSTVTGKQSGALGRVKEDWDRAVNFFFAELYPKREAWLNRSPVFRQYYYDFVSRYLDELSEPQINLLIGNITEVARQQGKVFANEKTARIWIGKYVGSSELADKMFDIKNGVRTTGGQLNLEQVDSIAKGFALDETKQLFYNAAEKSNFADITRIIAPFGTAWAEVTKKWATMLSSDPETLKRVGVTVQGLQDADPDADGKGFFYRNPQTNEYEFNFPYSDQLAPFILGGVGVLTGAIAGGLPGAVIGGAALGGAGLAIQPQLEGISPVFTAPLKSLSMGMSLLPGAGPYVQVLADWFIGDKPEADFIKRIISPYGTPDVSLGVLPIPSWGNKLIQAITANPESDRQYADLKLEVLKNLSTSRKYDLTTEQGKLDIEKDAANKARWLLVIQALGQFTGPARPSVDFKVDTKQGDVMANVLSKAMYEMRATNFDNYVEQFLETFGDDVFVYLQGKTVSEAGGLDVSKEFGDWERENPDLMRKYPGIAGYFAPVGSSFDYRVYLRQLESGDRRRLTAQELLDEAQVKVGSAMYRSVVRRIGPKPNEMQTQILRDYRNELGRQFPGFREREIDINQQKARIEKLYEAVNDPELNDNTIADALKVYFGYRDEAIAAANELGLVGIERGKKAAELRNILREVGEDLASSFPEFERIWEYVLYDEVDLLN